MKKRLSMLESLVLVFLVMLAPTVVVEGTEINIHSQWAVHKDELQRSAAEYMKQHPSVKINVLGTGDVKTTVPVLLASGSIDAALISVEQYSSYVSQGFFQSIEPFLEKDPTMSKQDFVPFLTDLYSYQGQWYCLPFNWGPAYFHYNVDLFQNAGLTTPDRLDAQKQWNWETFGQSVRRMSQDKNGDGTLDIYGYRVPAHATDTLINAWVTGNGGGFVDHFMSPTKVTINSSATLQTLEFLRGLIVNQSSSPITNTKYHGWGPDHNAFKAGTLGIYDQWMSGSNTVMTASKSGAMTHEWGVVAPPVSPIGKRASDIGSAFVGIAANSKNAAVVYDFLKFHLGNVDAMLTTEYLTSLPTLRRVLQNPEIQKRLPVPQREVIMNAPNYPAFRMTWVQQSEFWKIAKAQLTKFWKGEAALDQAVSEAQRLEQTLLDSSR